MSALGQKQTFRRASAMSALLPKADILGGVLPMFSALLFSALRVRAKRLFMGSGVKTLSSGTHFLRVLILGT